MNKYIADLHFGHANVIEYSNRPYGNVEEMDEDMVRIWRDSVSPLDDVWIVGDLIYKAKDPKHILEQLTGKLHLIRGNHDHKFLKNRSLYKYFESVDDIRIVWDGGQQVVLCHYPMAEWPGYFRNAVHLYGHIHNTENEAKKIMDGRTNCYNVGIDCIHRPMTLREIRDFYWVKGGNHGTI